jgi:hypothetical protein
MDQMQSPTPLTLADSIGSPARWVISGVFLLLALNCAWAVRKALADKTIYIGRTMRQREITWDKEPYSFWIVVVARLIACVAFMAGSVAVHVPGLL